jgi:hypothetical protein
VFRYLKHTMTSADLVLATDTPDHLSEAHVVIGLEMLLGGQRIAAMDSLRRAADGGSERSIARDLARATLQRIEAAGAKSSTTPAQRQP